MDIYVPRKAYKSFRKELCKLLHVAPSTISTMDLDTGDQEGYAVSSIMGISYLKARSRMFQIIQSSTPAADYPIASFHSTLVMNKLTYDHLAIAYPRLTLKEHGVISPDMTGHRDAVLKCIQRGYKLQYNPQGLFTNGHVVKHAGCGSAYVCAREVRTFYDSKALIVPILGNQATIPKKTVQWEFGGFGCGEDCVLYHLGEERCCELRPGRSNKISFVGL